MFGTPCNWYMTTICTKSMHNPDRTCGLQTSYVHTGCPSLQGLQSYVVWMSPMGAASWYITCAITRRYWGSLREIFGCLYHVKTSGIIWRPLGGWGHRKFNYNFKVGLLCNKPTKDKQGTKLLHSDLHASCNSYTVKPKLFWFAFVEITLAL